MTTFMLWRSFFDLITTLTHVVMDTFALVLLTYQIEREHILTTISAKEITIIERYIINRVYIVYY